MMDMLIGFMLCLVVLGLMVLAANRGKWRTPNWLIRLGGGVPWAPGLARVMTAVSSDKSVQNSHEVYFVPRQEIAECGLACPKCSHEVAQCGDFTEVVRAIVDGQENEVIKCRGLIDVGDGRKPVPCPAWLAAAPNTEHGDDLIEGDPPEFYQFTRITQAQALREKYGIEISQGIDSLVADPKQRPEGAIFAEAIPWSAVCVKESPATQTAADAVKRAEDDAMRQVIRPFAEDETRILPTIDPNKDI